MFTRRIAKLAAALLFALTLAQPLAPAAHAQAASMQGCCGDSDWIGYYAEWVPCSGLDCDLGAV
jgi:hypothetical protein